MSYLRCAIIVTFGMYRQSLADGAFHFNRFSGPVSGPISKVALSDSRHGGPSYDYVAKPDYNFAYGVEDPHTGNYQNQKEERHGDVVKGEYSLVGADGITRRVTYTADSVNGFQATVHTSPVNAQHAGQQARYAAQQHRSIPERSYHVEEDDHSDDQGDY